MTDQEKAKRYDEIQSWYWWLERRTHEGITLKDNVKRFLNGIEDYLDKYEVVQSSKVENNPPKDNRPTGDVYRNGKKINN